MDKLRSDLENSIQFAYKNENSLTGKTGNSVSLNSIYWNRNRSSKKMKNRRSLMKLSQGYTDLTIFPKAR